MFVTTYKNIFLAISGGLVALALASIFIFGLPLGIDFTGGSILEGQYDETRPPITTINDEISSLDLSDAYAQPTGETGVIVRTASITEEDRRQLVETLSLGGEYPLTIERFNSIGPTIGQELRSRAWIALGGVILAIILFIAYAFRHVSRPVSSWKYGIIAIIALFHDILIPTGVFAAVGYTVDTLFVIALLAILGLSVNDTIVVFDRIRENLREKVSQSFTETVGMSVKQTFTRSINTSLTTLFVLLALYFIGPESTQHFALTLAIGIAVGTYSSIFLASPLLLTIASTDHVPTAEEEEKERKEKEKQERERLQG